MGGIVGTDESHVVTQFSYAPEVGNHFGLKMVDAVEAPVATIEHDEGRFSADDTVQRGGRLGTVGQRDVGHGLAHFKRIYFVGRGRELRVRHRRAERESRAAKIGIKTFFFMIRGEVLLINTLFLCSKVTFSN